MDIAAIKEGIAEFDRTENTKFIHDAVDILVYTMREKLDTLRGLKNRVNYVHYDEDDQTYHLIQRRFAPDAFEQNLGEDKKVSQTRKTLKVTNKPPGQGKKTRKNRKLVLSEAPLREPLEAPLAQEEPLAEPLDNERIGD